VDISGEVNFSCSSMIPFYHAVNTCQYVDFLTNLWVASHVLRSQDADFVKSNILQVDEFRTKEVQQRRRTEENGDK
jgi:hypothetical protein